MTASHTRMALLDVKMTGILAEIELAKADGRPEAEIRLLRRRWRDAYDDMDALPPRDSTGPAHFHVPRDIGADRAAAHGMIVTVLGISIIALVASWIAIGRPDWQGRMDTHFADWTMRAQ